jgi:signal transduction histidine kinase/CheY-like chemotaxis protein
MPESVASISIPDFRLLFESAPGLYLVLAADFRIVAVSDAYLRATMTEKPAILGRKLFDVFPDNPNDPAATGTRNLRASLTRVLDTRAADTMAVQKYDIRRPESEGGQFEERFWSPINSPVLDAAGEIVYIIHRVEDVTDFVRLKRVEGEQEKTAESLKIRSVQMETEIFQRSQELAEANRQLQTANQELARLYRQTASLLALAKGDLAVQGDPGADLSAANLMSPEDMLESVRQLITGHKQLEEQLRHSQKMEAVGRLAGGIAHDFNNILTVIIGYCSVLLGRIEPDDPIYPRFTEIQKAGERAAALTQQLLAFSRKQILQPRVVHLGATLEEMDRMLRRVLGQDVEVATTVDRELGQVKIDPSQVEQVLMNLAVNARDAMPHGGKLTLELHNIELLETTPTHYDVPPGQYVMLAVSDNGTGMDAELQRRVFEPYFTTKAPGKGTGLGLSTVYGIVKQSGGYIWLYSEPGMGTTFKIFFPEVHEEPEVVSPFLAVEPAPGTETVLVVEDDDRLRELVKEILEYAGYTILLAGGPAEAISIAQRSEGEIQLLITDFVLPGMNGRELAERVTAVRPRMKVLFMSGYTADAIANREGVAGPEIAFLPKPFTAGALRVKVRATLDAQRTVRRVLVVDDEPSVCTLLETILKDGGFSVVTAEDGRHAQARLSEQAFDLMITDLAMPDVEGIEMIRTVRKQYPGMRIIAISGAFGSEILDMARVLGADASLHKPLTAEVLLACIEKVAAKRVRL